MVNLDSVTKTYRIGDIAVEALRGVSLRINQGEFVAIMGASGSGKSTLMNIIGCLDTPSSGQYTLLSREVGAMNRRDLARIRNRCIGFVFQNFNLIRRTTALENVELPVYYQRNRKKEHARERARMALEKVGLADRVHHVPNQLSGGQQQRVAIARALVNEPPLLLADEPTGALDSVTSIEIMALFQQLNRQGKTVILVTHEQDIAQYAGRLIRMLDGVVVADERIISPRVAEAAGAEAPIQTTGEN
ncbi:MAG: ABC transporter ATP-binding protein [Chitinispirillaceae bacterium]|nr:ABC transporter ATP-binding protein [Chitinispirillaceae bacterium]